MALNVWSRVSIVCFVLFDVACWTLSVTISKTNYHDDFLEDYYDFLIRSQQFDQLLYIKEMYDSFSNHS